MSLWGISSRRPSAAAKFTFAAAGALSIAALSAPQTAEACGCFAPPDPTVPIVQAGERIVFAHQGGNVVAHIQIQYQGEAQDFGWILPLPSVPTMKLGVEELFVQLINATQPKYRLVQVTGDSCEWQTFQGRGGFAGVPTSDSSAEDADGKSVLVVQASVGPYDYAVLRADDKKEMLKWLADNRYFVPAGTENVVDPYIRPGAFFLALKLQKGNDVGDLQPIILEYQSDLPMIPLILTQVAANPDMGIQVWMLGEHRAIPRNFRHAVINQEHIDWSTAGANYNDVIIKAVDEAEGHHAFVSEYAGSSEVMRGILDYEGRFGDRTTLEGLREVGPFVSYLRQNGFIWSSSLTAALRRTWPMPQTFKDVGIQEEEFYNSLDWYTGEYFRQENPMLFEGVDFSFDPVELATDLWDRIATPTLDAGKLFRTHPKLTRLYTTLSPEEMTRDPVFSFNPDLPDVPNVHEATLEFLCNASDNQPNNTPAMLRLPDGRQFFVNNIAEFVARDRTGIPFASRIELLREEGVPVIDVDNGQRISESEVDEGGGGCACAATGSRAEAGLWTTFGLLGVALLIRKRRV